MLLNIFPTFKYISKKQDFNCKGMVGPSALRLLWLNPDQPQKSRLKTALSLAQSRLHNKDALTGAASLHTLPVITLNRYL